ncbi:DUF1294 domain-containing protein [Flavobacterium sp. W22_SRS_FK3]|uniref:DUF1294 domain-containing protein n=1 Tax=Flavobacterium sp. W22_SRS_FK3 TaxID=3240275 RepID=UPI003F93C76F
MEVLFAYFFIVNGLSFLLAGYDKYLARNNKRRISENTLFLMALLGGSIGLLLAMLMFRHKTSKTSFIIKFALIFLVQIIILCLQLSNKL